MPVYVAADLKKIPGYLKFSKPEVGFSTKIDRIDKIQHEPRSLQPETLTRQSTHLLAAQPTTPLQHLMNPPAFENKVKVPKKIKGTNISEACQNSNSILNPEIWGENTYICEWTFTSPKPPTSNGDQIKETTQESHSQDTSNLTKWAK
ncbi:hypothetical protein HELRODRAFT_178436 [Helobdella robusta]|uniref:Uncharacterized protein n=1 Tax=Helobdella robusta TaxID=6412 RepID=T1FD60_HELRO|nr:hypothetical protein HELRODRAFT_178436 [Helobdella robusta]ESN97003.1 hypothetical protein HELRODRAFT_178436 [Helobdella robusta]